MYKRQVYQKSQSIRFIGDKENANTDSALVATKRCLIFNELNKRLYRKFFMTQDELQACKAVSYTHLDKTVTIEGGSYNWVTSVSMKKKQEFNVEAMEKDGVYSKYVSETENPEYRFTAKKREDK